MSARVKLVVLWAHAGDKEGQGDKPLTIPLSCVTKKQKKKQKKNHRGRFIYSTPTPNEAHILPGLTAARGSEELSDVEEHRFFCCCFPNTCFVLCFQSSPDLYTAEWHFRRRST